MGYKIKITLILKPKDDFEEITYVFKEKFIRNYEFTMDYLEDIIDEGNEDLKPFYNHFKKVLGCEDEIFSLFNEKPRSANK